MILGSLLFVFNLQSSSENFCQAKTAPGMSSLQPMARGENSAAGVPCSAPSPSPSPGTASNPAPRVHKAPLCHQILRSALDLLPRREGRISRCKSPNKPYFGNICLLPTIYFRIWSLPTLHTHFIRRPWPDSAFVRGCGRVLSPSPRHQPRNNPLSTTPTDFFSLQRAADKPPGRTLLRGDTWPGRLRAGLNTPGVCWHRPLPGGCGESSAQIPAAQGIPFILLLQEPPAHPARGGRAGNPRLGAQRQHRHRRAQHQRDFLSAH